MMWPALPPALTARVEKAWEARCLPAVAIPFRLTDVAFLF